MKIKLDIILIEDNPMDYKLLTSHLSKRFDVKIRRVETEEDYRSELNKETPDFILSDYNLPKFDGLRALSVRNEESPSIPFFLITGELSEESAVELMESGADDYIFKDNLQRLIPAIKRELHKTELRREREELESEKELLINELSERVKELSMMYLTSKLLQRSDISEDYLLEAIVNKIPSAFQHPDFTFCRISHNHRVFESVAFEETDLKISAEIESSENQNGLIEVYVSKYDKSKNKDVFLPDEIILIESIAEMLSISFKQRKSSADLLEREEYYRRLTENFPNGIVSVYDKDLNLEFIAGQDLNRFKLDSTSFIGKNLSELASEETFKKAEPIFKAALSGKTGMYHALCWNDQLYDVTVTPLTQNGNGFKHVMAVSQNVTDQVLSKQKQAEAEQKLIQILEHSVNLFYSHDNEGILTYVSPRSKEFLGCEPDEAMKHWTKFITNHPENKRGIEATEAAIKNGIAQTPYELELQKKNGEKIWVEVREAPVVKNGNTIAIVGSLTDITEKKNTLSALYASEEKYRDLVENISDLVYSTDKNGNINFVSSSIQSIAGYSPEEVIGQNFIKFFEPDDHQTVKNRFKDLATNKVSAGEYRIKTKSGEVKYIRTSSSAIINNGEFDGVRGIISDITENKHVQDRLKFKSHLLNEIGESIIATDIEGKITYWNRAAEKLYLWKSEEVIGKNILDVTPNDLSVQEANEILSEVLKGNSWSGEFVVKRKNGSTFPAEVTDSPVIDENGNVVGIIGISSDISERKEIQNALEDNEKLLTQTQGIAHLGSWELDHETKRLYWSKEVYNIFGITEEEFDETESGFHILVHPDDKNELLQTFQSSIESDPGYEFEHRIIKKNTGEIRIVQEKCEHIRDSNGKVLRSVGMVQDITDKKKMMSELIAAKTMAEEANKLKSIFLANMSHELRTPMVGIIGYAELMAEMVKDAEIKGMADQLLQSGQRLNETLNSILDLSRIEADVLGSEQGVCNINQIIKDSIKLYSPIADKKNLFLRYHQPEKEFFIEGSPAVLSKALNNLINNGIKFTNEGGIAISTRLIGENKISIEVQDSGIGIPNDKQELIFEPFRQASEGMNRTFDGTGLGLTITKKYINSLKGKISLKSAKGEGTSFYLEFPCIESNNNGNLKAEPNEIINTSSISEKKRILSIEDDEVAASIIKTMLGQEYILHQTANGEDGVLLAKANDYDLILMDISLSGKYDGLDTIREIRKLNRYINIPIIAVTAHAMSGDKEVFIEQGCDDYISKPFNKKDFIEKIGSILYKTQPLSSSLH